MKDVLVAFGLQKQFGERVVVDIPALCLKKGEAVAVTGPNGAGKTTLMEMLALLLVPDAGEIRLFGQTVPVSGKKRQTLRRSVVLLDQHPVLFRGRVIENAAYGLRRRGISRRESLRLAGEALETVGLGHLASRNAKKLSGGEVQRVALARALAVRPAVLLCDEPTASVDPAARPEVLALLDRFREQGGALLYSTHDPERELVSGCRRLHLRDGKTEPEVPV